MILRSPGVIVRGALAAAIPLGGVSGCQTVPFRADSGPGPAVLGFGAPAPYVTAGPLPDPGLPAQTQATGLGMPAGGWRGADGSTMPGRYGRQRSGPDVYAATRPGLLSPAVRGVPERVYVPAADGGTVDVIDPATYQVRARIRTGGQPERVVPGWDLRTLWVTSNTGDELVPVDPRTGRRGAGTSVAGPYNLYFTPNGRWALVLSPRLRRISFHHPHTMRLRHTLPVPCRGLGHADFSATGTTLVASCATSGQLIQVDVERRAVTGVIRLPHRSEPHDVRISPDGRSFYVADPIRHGVWVIDGERFRQVGFVGTGRGARGLHVSRDGTALYVSNSAGNSITVVSLATRRAVRTWWLPAGTSPDIGGVSADGQVLWLSARHHAEVYAISTRTGRLLRRIRVGGRPPRGVCVFPQPGRYSLGHTGVFR